MSKKSGFLSRIISFLSHGIWKMTENELSRTRRLVYRFVKIVVLATRGFINDRLNVKASALTYSILFAVVPMVALLIAVGKGFGVETLIESALNDSFVAQSDLIPTLMGFVKHYLDSTQSGIFIGVGIAILLYSVMNFFIQVELAFNAIWQVKKARSIINQFTMYFSAMFFIPILIVISSGFSIYVNTILSGAALHQLLSPLLRFGVYFAPYFINWVIFSVMYLVIPNTKVKFLNALIAGIIAGSAFQLFQLLYINGQVYLSRYNVVYGSFAAIPLLLLWLQVSCLIVLLGAEISYASQNIQNYDYEIESRNISHRYKNFLTLFITYVIVKQFEAQKNPYSSFQIASEFRLPIRLVNQILTRLVEAGVLIEVFYSSEKTKTFLPAIDINQLTIHFLFEKTESYGSEDFLTNKNEMLDNFWHKNIEFKKNSDLLTDNTLIKDL